jgi:hypothetical protein
VFDLKSAIYFGCSNSRYVRVLKFAMCTIKLAMCKMKLAVSMQNSRDVSLQQTISVFYFFYKVSSITGAGEDKRDKSSASLTSLAILREFYWILWLTQLCY